MVSTSIHINRRRCGRGLNVRQLMVVILFDPWVDILNSIRLSSVPLVAATCLVPQKPHCSSFGLSYLSHTSHTQATHEKQVGCPRSGYVNAALSASAFLNLNRPRWLGSSGGPHLPTKRHMIPSRSYLSRNRPGVS